MSPSAVVQGFANDIVNEIIESIKWINESMKWISESMKPSYSEVNCDNVIVRQGNTSFESRMWSADPLRHSINVNSIISGGNGHSLVLRMSVNCAFIFVNRSVNDAVAQLVQLTWEMREQPLKEMLMACTCRPAMCNGAGCIVFRVPLCALAYWNKLKNLSCQVRVYREQRVRGAGCWRYGPSQHTPALTTLITS